GVIDPGRFEALILSEPRTQRSGVSGETPAYSAALRARLGRSAAPLDRGAFVGGQVAFPGGVTGLELHRLHAVQELDTVERQALGLVLRRRGLRQRGGQLLVVERRGTLALLGIDQDELLRPAACIIAVPEAAVVVE